MKIGPSSDISPGVNPPAPASTQKSGQSAVATASLNANSAGVAVTVSTLARSMEKAQGSDVADLDASKVDAVRTAIKEGTFVVNAEAIADKLLANAKEMLDRTRN